MVIDDTIDVHRYGKKHNNKLSIVHRKELEKFTMTIIDILIQYNIPSITIDNHRYVKKELIARLSIGGE